MPRRYRHRLTLSSSPPAPPPPTFCHPATHDTDRLRGDFPSHQLNDNRYLVLPHLRTVPPGLIRVSSNIWPFRIANKDWLEVEEEVVLLTFFFHLRTQQGPVECNKKQENFIRMRASHSSGWNVDTPVVKWAPLIISHYGRCAARFNRATGVEVSASSGRIAGSDYTSPLCSSANRYTFSFFPFFPVGLVAFLSFLVFPWTHYSTHPMPIAHFLFPPLVYDPFHLIRYYNHLSRSSVISFPSIRMLFHSNVFAFYIPLITKLSINKWE